MSLQVWCYTNPINQAIIQVSIPVARELHFRLFRSAFIWLVVCRDHEETMYVCRDYAETQLQQWSQLLTCFNNTFVFKIYKYGFIGSTWLFYFHQLPISKCVLSACIFLFCNPLVMPHSITQFRTQTILPSISKNSSPNLE